MPSKFLSPLLFLFPKTRHSELARQLQYLKAENEVLRAKLPEHIRATRQDRRHLLRLGRSLGPQLSSLMTIVTYATFVRWKRQEHQRTVAIKVGRSPVTRDLVETVLWMARDNHWGYSRILGELRKLRFKVSRSTVRNILKEHGFLPRPKKNEERWDHFLKRHGQTIWACDFLSKKIWTRCGLLECFALFFINIATRRIHVAGVTVSPERQWMAQQARNLCMMFDDLPQKPVILLRDGDSKFTKEFDEIIESEGVRVQKLPPYSPDLNGHAERWVQSVKHECLNHFIVFGVEHMRHLVEEYAKFYNTYRPHQSRSNLPLSNQGLSPPGKPPKHGDVKCQEFLGGWLKHYYRGAS